MIKSELICVSNTSILTESVERKLQAVEMDGLRSARTQ